MLLKAVQRLGDTESCKLVSVTFSPHVTVRDTQNGGIVNPVSTPVISTKSIEERFPNY